MITLQHTASFVFALAERRRLSKQYPERMKAFIQDLHDDIPWLLLPDAIRAYVGPRQASHFEKLPDGFGGEDNVSWMEFPSAEVLKTLTKETVSEKVSYSVKEGYPKCVIGEDTQMGEFDIHNYEHVHYSALRCHLVQDCYLDAILREKMVDCSNRFQDRFVIRHSNQEIDGKELRAQVALFEKFGFIKLVGMVYRRTGILLNREWFETHVRDVLKEAYPADLVESTYKYMEAIMNDELNDRINNHDFILTESEKQSVIIADDLDEMLDLLYSHVIRATFMEI